MRHIGLKIRMAVVGAILAAFYLIGVAAAMVVFGQGVLPIAIVGSLLLVGIQYKVGKWAALRSPVQSLHPAPAGRRRDGLR